MDLAQARVLRDDLLAKHKVLVVGKTTCPHTTRTKGAISQLGVPGVALDVDRTPSGDVLQEAFKEVSGLSTVPQVFVAGSCVGGCEATLEHIKNGTFQRAVELAGVDIPRREP